jgi:diguanylate cyclase (GGDEF)-like protein
MKLLKIHRSKIQNTSSVSTEPIQIDYEKQIYDLKQLLEISKSLNSTLDYNILIDSILYICMAQMKVVKAGLFARKSLDAISFTLQRNFKGFEIEPHIEYSIPEDHPLIELFSQKYDCYTLEDIQNNLGSLEGLELFKYLDPSLLVPLKAKGQINGILIIGERIDERDFDAYEREYLLNIATLASISINNAFLFEMTTTDMMTKLKMKHYFYTVLMDRFSRLEDEKPQFSIIMMDIDFFKRFNDTYGHSCGDIVLQAVAKTISENVRSMDLAARYGGEEFVVLLSEGDKTVALQIAERIRSAVEKTETEYENQKLKVTISCGVACFTPEVDKNPRMVVDRADKALYRSKQEGRNRVSFDDHSLRVDL